MGCIKDISPTTASASTFHPESELLAKFVGQSSSGTSEKWPKFGLNGFFGPFFENSGMLANHKNWDL